MNAVLSDSPVPFVPSLLGFGHTEHEIMAIVDGLITRIADLATVVVCLNGDPERALRRAVVREGPQWLDWFGDKLVRYDLVPPRPRRADVCEFLAYERDVTLRVLERTPWHLIVIPDPIDQTPQAVVDAVVERLPAA